MSEVRHGESGNVDVVDIRHAFGSRTVFAGLSCRFPRAKISSILGGSGVGKSTLLRMIAALVRPDRGEVWLGDQEISAMSDGEIRRFRRRIGMLFQGGALLDAMSVFDNVALPLREHTRLSEAEIEDLVLRQFEAVGLRDVGPLLPAELSGGMRKRAALARAMIMEPEILLCDEPFSGLDPLGIRTIEKLLVDLNRRVGVTLIMTNHDMGSTLRMSDQIAFLCDGSAICGPADEIRRSLDRRIARFFAAAAREELPERDRDELEA